MKIIQNFKRNIKNWNYQINGKKWGEKTKKGKRGGENERRNNQIEKAAKNEKW